MTGEITAVASLIASTLSAAAAIYIAVWVGKRSGKHKIAELRQQRIEKLSDDLAEISAIFGRPKGKIDFEDLSKLFISCERIIIRLDQFGVDYSILRDSLGDYVSAAASGDIEKQKSALNLVRKNAHSIIRAEWLVIEKILAN